MRVSTDYAWRTRPESPRARFDRQLTQAIRLVHAESDGTYGSRFRVTSKSGPVKVSNLLDQDFSAKSVNERWASDITFIWTGQGWLYLAVVMDLYSRKIVGWSMSRRINRHIVVDAMKMALNHRRPTGDLIHHSDRGSQYLSDDFQDLLKQQGITCSMSGRGSCYDNAVVESFFASLKRERTRRKKYKTREQARADVFDYIERFYNRQRRHGYVGNISPGLTKPSMRTRQDQSARSRRSLQLLTVQMVPSTFTSESLRRYQRTNPTPPGIAPQQR
jgi:putative transposase